MERVLGVHEYRRDLNSRSLDEYANALPLCFTPHRYKGLPLKRDRYSNSLFSISCGVKKLGLSEKFLRVYEQ